MSKLTKKYVCTGCGSPDIRFDAWAVWNEQKQKMELFQTFPNVYCEECEGETSFNQIDEIEQEKEYERR